MRIIAFAVMSLFSLCAFADELDTTPNDDLASSFQLWNIDRNKLESALARGANPNILMCSSEKSYVSTNNNCSKYNWYKSPLWAVASSYIKEDKKADLIRFLASKGATAEKRMINARDGEEMGGLMQLFDGKREDEKSLDKAATILALINAGFKIPDSEFKKLFRYASDRNQDYQIDVLQQISPMIKEQALKEIKERENTEKQAALQREQAAKEAAVADVERLRLKAIQVKIDVAAEKVRVKAEEAQQSKERKQVATFRKSISDGDETNCGPVIEVKGKLVKIAFAVANYGNEHWVRRDEIFPSGYGCRFINGQYQMPN